MEKHTQIENSQNNIKSLISYIRILLGETFAGLEDWFLKDEKLSNYKPQSGGWSINQILEHVALTNYFLLILIDKGMRKALANKQNEDLEKTLENYNFHFQQLNEVGEHKAFQWIRPEHMEPKGEKSMPEIREELNAQLIQCLDVLDKLPNGEGALAKTTMTVNNLGKIDVYEYIYFLAKHGERHITQMEKIEQEFNEKQ